ncbi:hypothetical protein ACSMDF_04665 [Yersinia enterocolitica]
MLSEEQYQVYQDRVEMSDSEYEMVCVPTRDLRELLSLREQLAELKALEPIGQVIFGGYGSDGIREASVVCLHDQADWDNFPDGTLLFTAAKPAEDCDDPVQPFKAGDLIVQRHCNGEDYAIVSHAHPNGGLDVTHRDTGIRYGWTAWRCKLVSRPDGSNDNS